MPYPNPPEPLFDAARPFTGAPAAGLCAPLLYDVRAPALRLRTLNFAAKRLADMIFVSNLPEADAMARLRWRAVGAPGGLDAVPPATAEQQALDAARKAGQISVEVNEAARAVRVAWRDPAAGIDLAGSALAPPGYGGIVTGSAGTLGFDPAPIPRAAADPDRAWPLGDGIASPPAAAPDLAAAVDALFAACRGIYGLLIATPEQVLLERYGAGGAADRATPSWSMTKAMTATMIGRMLRLGWLSSVHMAAPAPLWGDPRGAHADITLDHLLHMRSGLAMPLLTEDGRGGLGFENSAVYQDAADAFEAAQRSIVAVRPGSTYRYVNTGLNVLGAVIRSAIERRGLGYHATMYEMLADALGMTSFRHSADIAGNLIASGSGAATLRDYAKLGVLYLQDGRWRGEQFLPRGFVEYALSPGQAGSAYGACFRSNADRLFASLPASAAWATGASDQRIFILRHAGLVVAMTNETDHPIDLARLEAVLATACAGR
ncbi:MAG: serine hydrolase [Rhodospirillales bacterium]|nr:serine hydrolase [Rhodospirillales bacterium]